MTGAISRWADGSACGASITSSVDVTTPGTARRTDCAEAPRRWAALYSCHGSETASHPSPAGRLGAASGSTSRVRLMLEGGASMPALTTRLAPAGNEWAWVTDGTRMNGSKSELLAIDAVTASYQGCNAMRLVGNGAMEFVWQGLCSIAGGYVRRAYNSAQWDEVPCAFVPAAMRRPRGCSSRRSGLVTALCAAVGIAFLLPPPPAFAQSTTLVSNLDRLSTLKPAAGIYAQGFSPTSATRGQNAHNSLISGSRKPKVGTTRPRAEGEDKGGIQTQIRGGGWAGSLSLSCWKRS